MNGYVFFPVFWNGKHQNAGDKKEWTFSDVYKIFTSTVAKGEKIPFTIDHPANDLPIIGYTDAQNIRFIQDGKKATIEVRPVEFAKEILEQVKKTGRKRVSVALNSEDFSIRHIGLVEKPAVADLPAIPFEKAEEIFNIELENENVLTIEEAKKEMQKTKNFEAEAEKLKNALSENEDLKTELQKLKEDVAKLKAEREVLAKEKRLLEFKQYLENNHREQIPPVVIPKILRIMEVLNTQPTYTFMDNGEQKEATPLQEFKEFLCSLPKVITFNEYATDDKVKNGGEQTTINIDQIITEFNKQRR